MLDLGKTEHSHQAALCQSATASVSSRSALLARGAKTLPSCAFMGHLCVDSTVSPFSPTCKAVPCSYNLHISYFVLVQINTRWSEAGGSFFAQSHNSASKEGNKIKNKKPMSQMKEHTCYALITAPTLRTSAPLNQQPEVEAWLSEYTPARVALRAETFTVV